MSTGPFAADRLMGLCAPLLLWALHFVVVYSVQGLACSPQTDGLHALQDQNTMLALIVITALILALITWLGWRAWRMRGQAVPTSRRRFVSSGTALTSALAAVAVLFTGTPLLILSPCH